MQALFYELFFLCICSHVFIHSLICKHWAVPFSHCSFIINYNNLFGLFISEKNVIKLPPSAAEGPQQGEEGGVD